MSKTIIGLSFGNSNSSIAYIKEGRAEVLANPDGDRQIPSSLAYIHGDELHGLQAKHQLIRNPASTVQNFRDFLGLKYAQVDPTHSHVSARPVEHADAAGFEVNNKILSVGELTASHLAKLKDAAADFIGKEIQGAVLAVPSNWSDAQRALLTNCASAAGLPILQIINEESSALLAHTTRPDFEAKDKLFVVADFGHTRSDAALVAYNGGIFTTLATAHDTTLGGHAVDAAIVEHLAKEFESQNKVDPRADPRALAKLTQEAELIKKTLSNSTITNYGIESVTQGIDFIGSMNRLKLELVARPVFSKFSAFIESLLKKAGIDALDVSDVLLVGGTSWIPKVASNVASIFEQATIISPAHDKSAVAPDELIARGAAIQGSLIGGFDADEVAESLGPQVLNGPHLAKAIGVAKPDGSVEVVIGQYTLLPIRKSISIPAEGTTPLEIVEVEREIKTETVKEENEDDESDWSDDEYEVRTRVLTAGKALAKLSIEASGAIELVVDINKDLKLNIAARSGSEIVKGSI